MRWAGKLEIHSLTLGLKRMNFGKLFKGHDIKHSPRGFPDCPQKLILCAGEDTKDFVGTVRVDNLSPSINPPNRASKRVINMPEDLRSKVDALKYHGTTTVAMVCTDGVVLCTDTRVTAGYLYIAHRRGKKIHKIDDHVGVTIAGTVAEAQNVIDTLRYYANIYKLEKQKPIPIKSLSRIVANIFFSQRFYPLFTDFLLGGYDEEDKNTLYSVDFFGALTREDAVSTGSGSPVAYGIIEDEFRKGMNVQQVIPIAIKAVTAAIKRNAGTGDGFDVAVIDKEKGYRELPLEDKQQQLLTITGSRSLG